MILNLNHPCFTWSPGDMVHCSRAFFLKVEVFPTFVPWIFDNCGHPGSWVVSVFWWWGWSNFYNLQGVYYFLVSHLYTLCASCYCWLKLCGNLETRKSNISTQICAWYRDLGDNKYIHINLILIRKNEKEQTLSWYKSGIIWQFPNVNYGRDLQIRFLIFGVWIILPFKTSLKHFRKCLF